MNAPEKNRQELTGKVANSAGRSCPRKRIVTWESTKSSYFNMTNWGKSSYKKTLKLLALLRLEE